MGVPKSGTWRGGVWQLAPCLSAMEAEADAIAPKRSRASDGSIGDHAHSVRKSDHNPDEEGRIDYVDALDLTHSPDKGFDVHAYAREVARNIINGLEDRLEYIISNWQIFSKKNGVWAWRKYTGENGHTHHAHFSAKDGPSRFNMSRWFYTKPLFGTKPIPPPLVPKPEPTKQYIPEDMMDKIIKRKGKEHYWFREVNGTTVWVSKAEADKIRKDYMAVGAPCPQIEWPDNAFHEAKIVLPK